MTTDRLSVALADRYRVLEHLGERGKATVYLAEDLKHDGRTCQSMGVQVMIRIPPWYLFVSWLAQFATISELRAQDPPETLITEAQLRSHVFFLASDWLQGRGTGTDGYRRAAEYSATQFAAAGLTAPGGAYLQPFRYRPDDAAGDSVNSWNVVALRPGADATLRDAWVVVTAHLDHLGVRDGEIHNGANDNATGSGAVLEIGRAIATTPGNRPRGRARIVSSCLNAAREMPTGRRSSRLSGRDKSA